MKEFFQKKWVRITSAVLTVIGIVGLALGGVSEEEINGLIKAVLIALASIGAVVTIISTIVSATKKK